MGYKKNYFLRNGESPPTPNGELRDPIEENGEPKVPIPRPGGGMGGGIPPIPSPDIPRPPIP